MRETLRALVWGLLLPVVIAALAMAWTPWAAWLWLVYPLVYFVYALLRGHLLGAYAYPFIDVAMLGYAQVFINAGGILLGFVAVALVLIGIDRRR